MLSLQKHIIICTQQFDNYWSGVGTYGTNLARGLVRTGWKVTVISPGEYSNENDEINGDEKFYRIRKQLGAKMSTFRKITFILISHIINTGNIFL